MKNASVGFLLVLVVALIGYWEVTRTASASANPELPEAFCGDWSVVHYEVTGVETGRFAECEFVGLRNGQSGIFAPNGLMSTVTLQGFDPADGGTAYLLIESNEDTPEMGGGGPRKAIARVTPVGQLEIIAARSSSFNYPADFGDNSKKDSICWAFSKNGD